MGGKEILESMNKRSLIMLPLCISSSFPNERFSVQRKETKYAYVTGIQTYRGSISGDKLDTSFEEAGKK